MGVGLGRRESCLCACSWSRGPATGLSCPHSLVADGPLEAHALLALEEALRVDLRLDGLELREAVRTPRHLLHRDAKLLALGVREVRGAEGRVVGLERPELLCGQSLFPRDECCASKHVSDAESSRRC